MEEVSVFEYIKHYPHMWDDGLGRKHWHNVGGHWFRSSYLLLASGAHIGLALPQMSNPL